MSPTFSASPAAMPFWLTLNLYNSAGELVRSLYAGAADRQPGRLDLPVGPYQGGGWVIGVDARLQSGGSQVLWFGDNDAGQSVGGGWYSLKMEVLDPWGRVETLATGVQVLRDRAAGSLRVYNGAGELVRSLPLPAGGAVEIRLDPAKAVLAEGGALGFELGLPSGAAQPFAWDGRDERGLPVQPGSYTLWLDQPGGKGQSLGVVVVRAPAASGLEAAQAGPNPARLGETLVVRLPGPPAQGGLWAGLYNAAGELVTSSGAALGQASLSLPTRSLASGVYALVLELRQGGAGASRRVLKFAILQ